MGGGIDADDERHDPDEDDGAGFHHDGERQPLADQVLDRHGVLAAQPEVPAEDAADPGEVARDQRLIEAVEMAQLLGAVQRVGIAA